MNITDVRFFDIKSQAIIITGTDNVLYKNQIYGCVTENRYTAKTRTGGWNKCVSVMDGCCHQIKNNTISFSYGEKPDENGNMKPVYIEDFNLVASFSGDRWQRDAYGSFADLTSTYDTI